MKNNKGFTLIEVLLVILILAIISLIALPNIFDSINESKIKSYKQYEEYLLDNIELYNLDLKEDLWVNNDYQKTITEEDILTVNKDFKLNNKECEVVVMRITNDKPKFNYWVCMYCGKSNDGKYTYNGNKYLYKSWYCG